MCGDVNVTADDVTIILCVTTDEATYLLDCPECGRPIQRAASRPIMQTLIACGVRVWTWRWPDEPHAPGPPITVDDVIDFYEQCEAHEYLAVFAGWDRSASPMSDQRFEKAIVVTADSTFVKHRFRFRDETAVLMDRAGNTLRTLAAATSERTDTGHWRVTGTDSDGVERVWIVNDHCGCGVVPTVRDTLPEEVPA